MSNHLLSTDGTLVLSSSLAEELGSAEAAIILQQIHYWLSKDCGRIIDGVRWIYNTYDEWLKQIPWLSKWKLRQVLYKLREEKWLNFIQPNDHKRDRTGHYSINYEMLEIPSVSHVCYTALARVENQQMQMWLFTHNTETTPEKTASIKSPPNPQEESRGILKYFLGIKSNRASLATFKAMMESLTSVIGKLLDNPSAAVTPPKPKPNPPKYETEERAPQLDTVSLRRLSVVTGLSVSSLETNLGLNSAVKRHPENLVGVLDYLETECRSWQKKPGIGFIVNALREGRKLPESLKHGEYRELPKPTRDQCIKLRKLGKPTGVIMSDGAVAEGVEFPNRQVLPWWKVLGIPFEELSAAE